MVKCDGTCLVRCGDAPDLVAVELREPQSTIGTGLDHHGDGSRGGDEILRNRTPESDASNPAACVFGEPESTIGTHGDIARQTVGAGHEVQIGRASCRERV